MNITLDERVIEMFKRRLEILDIMTARGLFNDLEKLASSRNFLALNTELHDLHFQICSVIEQQMTVKNDE